MRKTIILICFLLSNNLLLAQNSPDTLWTKTFGGSNGDYAYSVQQTIDGGYIVAGATWSYGAGFADVWLIKTDGNGSEIWNKTFGEKGQDLSYSIHQTKDGGYIAAGERCYHDVLDCDVLLIRTDGDGNEILSKTFGGNFEDFANSVQQTTDGGYIVAGGTYSFGAGLGDVWLIKTDGDGNEVWSKTFGGDHNDYGNSVQQTKDGGYISAGLTESYQAGVSYVWLIKTDGNGNEIWDKKFGGNDPDWANSVQQTKDGGYIVAGATYSYGAGNTDAWLIKTDDDGNEIWNKTFGGSHHDEINCVQQTTDGGYILAGNTSSFGAGETDMWLIKTDEDGNEIWSKTIGGSYFDIAHSVQQANDGGYIVAGSTEPDETSLPDIWLVRVGTIGGMNGGASLLQSNFVLHQNYPNPFNVFTVICYSIPHTSFVTLEVFDVFGRKITELINEQSPAGNYVIHFDASYLSNGVYFYRLQAGSFNETKKFILIK